VGYFDDTESVSKRPIVVHPDGGACLVVGADGLFASYPLPNNGRMSIGRAPENDVCIDHPSISRRHAELEIGADVRIRDLESQNGTVLTGRRLEPHRAEVVRLGEMMRIGAVVMLIQETSAPRRASRWMSGSLERRLREECVRSARSGAQFGFAVVKIDGTATANEVHALFAQTMRQSDLVGATAHDVYELLLVDIGPDQARVAMERLTNALCERGVAARGGLACYPSDGASAHELTARAWTDLEERRTGDRPAVPGPMDRVRNLVEQVADSTLNVLIRGETGVGKEVCAESVHRLSSRGNLPFLRINCAALPEPLLESELFGHERGAFTGAVATKPGLFETADSGTVFLDEIGELPAGLQAKLLRVLEDRAVTRVGGLRTRTIDVRFIAATNSNVESDIEAGSFRRDLYYRLAGVVIDIPPLRERRNEIEGLARAFVARLCADSERRVVPELSREALEKLRGHVWPGNIRELRNTVERAVLLCRGDVIDDELILLHTTIGTSPDQTAPTAGTVAGDASSESAANGDAKPHDRRSSLRNELLELEKKELIGALEACGGNQTRAAKLLGIARGTLQSRMDTHGIPRPRKRRKKQR